jgi:site-specific recombinase XerD
MGMSRGDTAADGVSYVTRSTTPRSLAASTASLKRGGMKPSLEIRLTSTPHADEPVAKHSPNKGRKYPPKPFAPEVVQAILDACPDTSTGIRNRALVTLMYRAGLGVSETLNLRTSSIDFRTHSVQLPYAKSGITQTRRFPPSADDALQRWIQKREELGLGPGLLFCTVRPPPGGPLSDRYVRWLTADLAKRAGIDMRIHPNGFRYTFAAEAIQSGADVAELKELLGHKSIGHTARYIEDLTNGEPIARRQTYGGSQTEDQPDLLVRLYIPSARLYAAEAGRLFSMFSDWLTAIHGQGIRQSGYRTASGEMYEFFANTSIGQGDIRGEFDSFSSFLDLCARNPSAATDWLRSTELGEVATTNLVDRFGREARRLHVDLRYERERKVLELRHSLESELMDQGIDLSQIPSGQINSFIDRLVPGASAPESVALLAAPSSLHPTHVTVNLNPQIVHAAESMVVQRIQGTVNLGPRPKELLDLIERFGEAEATALQSAVHELEDQDAPTEKRSAAKRRLMKFLVQVAEGARDVGIDLLMKYLESKIL